jgi:small subunit ribosomal protein S1
MKGFNPEGWQTSAQKNQGYTVAELKKAQENREILEATAYMCDSEHNLLVNLGEIHGVIPRIEGAVGIEEGTTRDIAMISRVGKTVCFTVEEIGETEDNRLYAILSRRKAQEKCRLEFINRLLPGDVINARITHLETFGAFCDIGCGIISLLPIDCMSVSRISHPRDRFRNGQIIRAVVKNDCDEFGRITLTHRELLGTWEENASRFTAGQTAAGIVRSIEDYGVFIELAPNLAGLAECRDDVRVGQSAAVYIKNIIPDRMKVKLAIIDCIDSEQRIPDYEYPNSDHIDYWKYSPDGCSKIIESTF